MKISGFLAFRGTQIHYVCPACRLSSISLVFLMLFSTEAIISPGSLNLENVQSSFPSLQPIHRYRQPIRETDISQHKSNVWNGGSSTTSHKKVELSIGAERSLQLYYETAFENSQQTNRRVLVKAYIKLVEPRMQVSYPYNGRKVSGKSQPLDPQATKPPWWPPGVSHWESDHLPKAGNSYICLRYLACSLL